MPTAIIGMPRSGTSMTARMLNLSGLFLGGESEMVAAGEANWTGFWEHKQVLDINDRLLARFHADWENLPTLPEDWLGIARREGFFDEACACFRTAFSGRTSWGWKELRSTLLLPFWRQVAAEVASEPLTFVICIRNPLAVAGSVFTGARIELDSALALWHHYTEKALRETMPDERVIVFYEDLLFDPVGALAPALAFLGLPAVQPGSPEAAALLAFVDTNQQHHQFCEDAVLAHPQVPEYTKRLYAALRRGEAAISAYLLETDHETRALRIREAILRRQLQRMETILATRSHRVVEQIRTRAVRMPPLRRAGMALLDLMNGKYLQWGHSRPRRAGA